MHDWLPPVSLEPLKVANCVMAGAANSDDPMMLGPLEIINAAAARDLEASLDDCTQNVNMKTGEDHFLHDCAKRGQWNTFSESAKQGTILTDETCWPTYSKGCAQDCISFHPYDDLDTFKTCHADTKAQTQMDKADPNPWEPTSKGRLQRHSASGDGRYDIRPGMPTEEEKSAPERAVKAALDAATKAASKAAEGTSKVTEIAAKAAAAAAEAAIKAAKEQSAEAAKEAAAVAHKASKDTEAMARERMQKASVSSQGPSL